MLSRSRQNSTPPFLYYSKVAWVRPRGESENEKSLSGKSKQVDRDENVNGKRGTFSRKQNSIEDSQPGPSRGHSNSNNSFRDKPIPNVNISNIFVVLVK